jgi:hypothetical protein
MANDSDQIPFILSGKYFEIVSQENNGKSVTAKCKSCPLSTKNEFKGALSSTTNFLTHLKASLVLMVIPGLILQSVVIYVNFICISGVMQN